VRKVIFGQGRQLNKATAAVAQPAELALLAGAVDQGCHLEDQLKQEHRQAKEEEEQEDAFGVVAKTVGAAHVC